MTDVTKTETYQANKEAWQNTLALIAMVGTALYGTKGAAA